MATQFKHNQRFRMNYVWENESDIYTFHAIGETTSSIFQEIKDFPVLMCNIEKITDKYIFGFRYLLGQRVSVRS